MWALWSRWMTTCRTERLPASGSHYTSPRSSPRRSKSVGKFTEYFAHCSHQIHCTGDKVTVYQPVQSIVLKWQQGNNYSVCWSKHSFTVQRICSRYDVDFFHISLVWYSCAHMCAWMCGMMAEAGGGERASERAELFNLRLGWEISQGAMCHGEQAEMRGSVGAKPETLSWWQLETCQSWWECNLQRWT